MAQHPVCHVSNDEEILGIHRPESWLVTFEACSAGDAFEENREQVAFHWYTVNQEIISLVVGVELDNCWAGDHLKENGAAKLDSTNCLTCVSSIVIEVLGQEAYLFEPMNNRVTRIGYDGGLIEVPTLPVLHELTSIMPLCEQVLDTRENPQLHGILQGGVLGAGILCHNRYTRTECGKYAILKFKIIDESALDSVGAIFDEGQKRHGYAISGGGTGEAEDAWIAKQIVLEQRC